MELSFEINFCFFIREVKQRKKKNIHHDAKVDSETKKKGFFYCSNDSMDSTIFRASLLTRDDNAFENKHQKEKNDPQQK